MSSISLRGRKVEARMSDARQYKVLVLEDSPEDFELLQRRLSKTGLKLSIKHVLTKNEYADNLEKFGPDIIISDYKLPEFDGLSALALAKERNPGIPFIMISGFIDDNFASETLKAGVTDYILKDRPERLGAAVERALREAEQRRLEEEYEKRSRELEVENEEMRERESRVKQLRRELEALRNELKRL